MSKTGEIYQGAFNSGYEELCKFKWTYTKKTTGRNTTMKLVKMKDKEKES